MVGQWRPTQSNRTVSRSQEGGRRVTPSTVCPRRFVEAAGRSYRAGGGSIVSPPPTCLHEPGRFRVFLEDVSEVSERPQPPPRERVSPRSRAPSISSRSRRFRVRLPPPPPTFLNKDGPQWPDPAPVSTESLILKLPHRIHFASATS